MIDFKKTASTADKLVREALDSLDCSYPKPNTDDRIVFQIYMGSNEGCYVTIGDWEYRCHAHDNETILKAFALWMNNQ